MGSIPMKTLTIGENVFEIVDEQARNNIETLTNDIKNIIVEETDPTVPNWAKEPNKPTYTASEVGALPSTTKIPTKTSELDNDSGFLTSVPSEYVTDSELNAKGYLTSIPSEYVTDSELNSKGYLTEHQDLSDYAKKTDLPTVPTKTSQLSNDSGFLTSIPSEYVTESELSAKKYLTSIPSEYVTDEELERRAENITAVAHRELELKVVELQDQMSEYVHYDGTQGDPPINALLLSDADGEQYMIPYLEDYLIKPYNLPEANESTRGAMSAEDKQKLNNLPENLDLYVTETELTSKGYAKQTEVDSLSEEIDDKVSISQGSANVGKILIVGANGELTLGDIPENVSGDVIGTLDEDNNIVITGDLADGTYVFKYENTDGTYADIGSLVIGGVVQYSITATLTECTAVSGNAEVINEGETVTLNYTANDGFAFTDTVTVSGASYTWDSTTGTLVLSNPTADVTVVITATKSGVTNLADPTAAGWVHNSRIGSDGTSKIEGACAGAEVTNFILVSNRTKTIYIKGLDVISKLPDGNVTIHSRYSSANTSTYVSKFYGSVLTDSDGVSDDITMVSLGNQILSGEYIRFTGTLLDGYTAEDVVITIDEPITN